MLVDVMCLRREGLKLSELETRESAVIRGHLKFGYWVQQPFAGHPETRHYQASLHHSMDDRMPSLLPSLLDAFVTKIDIRTGTMLIIGTETIRLHQPAQAYPQTWWCRPVTPPGPPGG